MNLNLSPGLSHFFLLEGKGLVLLNFCRVFELETVHSISFFFFFTSLIHPVTHIKTSAFCSSVLRKGHFDMQIWGAMDPLSNLLITKRLALPSEPLNTFVDDDNSEYEFSLCVFWSGRFPWHEYFYWIVCLSFSLKHASYTVWTDGCSLQVWNVRHLTPAFCIHKHVRDSEIWQRKLEIIWQPWLH